MRRILAFLVLGGLVFQQPLPAKDHVPHVFDSVKPLQWLDEMSVARNHCTAWSVGEGLWMTAGHCALKYPDDEEGDQTVIPAIDRAYLIAGMPAHIAVIDLAHDLALFQGVHAEALVVSTRDVRFGDEIHMPGYPLGETRPTIFYGRIAAIHTDGDWMGLDMTACRGNSGSPVLDKHGAVVSVLQVGTGEACGTYDGGVLQDVLREFVKKHIFRPVESRPPFIRLHLPTFPVQ